MDSFWDFFWLTIVVFFFFAWLMVLFQILVDLFRDKDVSGGVKAVWVVALIIVPFITALIYLVSRGAGMASRSQASASAARAETDAYIRSVAGGGGAGTSPAEQISHAKQLLDSGAITETEFQQLKAKALS